MIDPINKMIVVQRNQVAHERRRLRAAAALLGEEMSRLVKQLDRDDREPIIDSIGIVQNMGNQVDAACGRYCAARDALEEACAIVTVAEAARHQDARTAE